ncbi:TRAP transporter large permease [Bacillus sp. FJAT-29790]|uniref:TRAP transporter large permease n=1 Tax=Bacillus sp. FJAT-29790 TaxID=1895002 RepID=UPI001C232591|nr:TRAP transporter large permease [Bacillus sp. FJAT-29790]MBU8881346.1 TRAP transporter large permease [Bacillus sp. FJAT-29790]
MGPILLFASFMLFLILSVPVAISVGLSSAIMVFQDGTPPTVIIQRLFTTMDSFTLLAVPFFILAGGLMERGGMSKRLVDFAYALVASRTGGLGMVAVLACMFFASISGSGVATVAAIGAIMIPAMVARGYDKGFASSTVAASGELGVIIPPSIPLILYGVATGVSIKDLFFAGIIPGIMIGFTFMILVYFVSKVKHYSGERSYSWKEKFVAFKDAVLALIMPFIILGGIYSGVFTPTESAVAACVYALIVGLFVYKELKWKELPQIFYNAALTSSVVLVIIANAGLFGWILTSDGVPQAVATWFSGISNSPFTFLLIINILLFIVGMFFDSGAAILILAPILVPVAVTYGIDPVHFGIVMIVNLAMGMITPPFGVNLFMVSEVASISMERLLKFTALFVLVMIFNILILSYIPVISTWLPQVFTK